MIFDWFKKRRIESRKIEERLYEVVVKELENGVRRDGLWAKALVESKGNETSAKSYYIELRVQSIVDEIEENSINLRYTEKSNSVTQADLEKENRIRNHLRKKFGREPTIEEVSSEKWTWEDLED